MPKTAFWWGGRDEGTTWQRATSPSRRSPPRHPPDQQSRRHAADHPQGGGHTAQPQHGGCRDQGNPASGREPGYSGTQHRRPRESPQPVGEQERQRRHNVSGSEARQAAMRDDDASFRRWVAQKDIRIMLCGLDAVLWPNARWSGVAMTQLTTIEEVKQCYHRAIKICHPDKVRRCETVADHCVQYASRVFDELTKAYSKLEDHERPIGSTVPKRPASASACSRKNEGSTSNQAGQCQESPWWHQNSSKVDTKRSNVQYSGASSGPVPHWSKLW